MYLYTYLNIGIFKSVLMNHRTRTPEITVMTYYTPPKIIYHLS